LKLYFLITKRSVAAFSVELAADSSRGRREILGTFLDIVLDKI
jgi:hypothetical protein